MKRKTVWKTNEELLKEKEYDWNNREGWGVIMWRNKAGQLIAEKY